MARGKGNKIMGIPPARLANREEYLTSLLVVPPGVQVVAQSGKRTLTFKAADLEAYQGERGRRGNKLPRGFQKVEGLELKP